MKRTGQWLLGLCFALLILLGAQALVEGPEETKLPLMPPPVAPAFMAAMEAADVPAGALMSAPEQSLRRLAACEAVQEDVPALLPVCESNGWPMVSRRWVKTVYNACRLEDRAG